MSGSSWTAPLKRNWTRGTPQVAGFVRMREGSIISVCHDKASDDDALLVYWLTVGPEKMSPELRAKIRTEWAALGARKT